jgi:hypothetical protein
MGAIAFTNKQELGGLPHVGAQRFVRVTATFSASYANPAGDTINPAVLGFVRVNEVYQLLQSVTKIGGRTVAGSTLGARISVGGTPTAPTLRAHVGAGTPTEVANATNLSSTSVELLIGGE